MKISKVFRCLKRPLRRKSRNTDQHDVREGRSAQTNVAPEDIGPSTAAVPQSLPSLPEQTLSSHPAPTENPEPQASGEPEPQTSEEPNATPNSGLHAVITVSETAPPPPEDTPLLLNRAYEALREKDAQLVDRYEKLLSTELEQRSVSQDTHRQNDDLDSIENQMNTNPDKRQHQLERITDQGLRRANEKQTKYTLFGHQFILRDQAAQAAQFVQAMKGPITEAAKASPEASVAWAGVSVLLPLFIYPSAAEEANRDGLSYTIFRIRYYVKLEYLLWPENLCEPGLRGEFESHIVDLYQHILEFQINTVIRFYWWWLSNLGRDLIRHDNWAGMLAKIKEREQIIRKNQAL
ncbi:hypothetical protein ACHAQH_003649 [Verticillium albo-atrum]